MPKTYSMNFAAQSQLPPDKRTFVLLFKELLEELNLSRVSLSTRTLKNARLVYAIVSVSTQSLDQLLSSTRALVTKHSSFKQAMNPNQIKSI